MTKEERHFLVCQDENCEKAYCVYRRDAEHRYQIVDKLKAAIEDFYHIVQHTNEFCLCARFKTPGFDYGEIHKRAGKAKSGARWITPRDKIAVYMHSTVEKLKEMGVSLDK